MSGVVGRKEVVGSAIIVDKYRLIAALVAVGSERLQESVGSCDLVRNGDADASFFVAFIFKFQMEVHHVLAGLRIAHHLRALDDAPGLDVMPDFVGDRKRDAAVGPVDEVFGRVAMDADKRTVAEIAVYLVLAEPVPGVPILEDAAAVRVDVIPFVVVPDTAVHVLAGNGGKTGYKRKNPNSRTQNFFHLPMVPLYDLLANNDRGTLLGLRDDRKPTDVPQLRAGGNCIDINNLRAGIRRN